MPSRGAQRLLIWLALVGLGLSSWLTYIHVAVHLDPTYSPVCAVGNRVNCEIVATSRYSMLWGVPLSVVGAVFYAVVAAIGITEIRGRRAPGHAALLALLGSGGALVSLVLGTLSLLVIRAVCLACIASYVVNFAILGATLKMARDRGGLAACAQKELAHLKEDKWPLVCGAVLAALFLVAGPGGGYPRYTELASWTSGADLPHGVDAAGLPWIGADHPRLVVHEYSDYECPACRISHLKLRRILGEHPSDIRVVRHEASRVPCVDPPGVPDSGRCSSARAAHCAASKGRFWDWNDAVNAHPRLGSGKLRLEYEREMAAALGFDPDWFMACVRAPDTITHVQEAYLASKKTGVRDTPTYFVEGKKMYFRELSALVDARF